MCSVSGTYHSTFQNVVNINVDSDSVIPEEKKMGVSKIFRKIVKFLTTEMMRIRALNKTRAK